VIVAAEPQTLLEALKAVAVVLKSEELRFALAGGFAVYARGGQDSRNDVDFVIHPDDVPAAKQALERGGITVLQPPEDWLFKARHDDAPVDLIHQLAMGDVDDALLSRSDELSVDSVLMPVLSATDLLVAKLMALSEHSCDLEPPLAVMRSLREQLDVGLVDRACRGQPFAETTLFLARRLGVLPEPSTSLEEE
jgi:Uncharacterised nucleotidyltransferase